MSEERQHSQIICDECNDYLEGDRDICGVCADTLRVMLDEARAENANLRQDTGALWTLISQISGPINKCFTDRIMPFAEFERLAKEWEHSVCGDGHPDTLRMMLGEIMAKLARYEAVVEAAREVIDIDNRLQTAQPVPMYAGREARTKLRRTLTALEVSHE